MNLSAVYAKTGKGAMALTGKIKALPSISMRVLTQVDGKTSAEAIMAEIGKLAEPKFNQILSQLLEEGYIRVVTDHAVEDIFSNSNISSSPMIVEEISAQEFLQIGTEEVNSVSASEHRQQKEPEYKAHGTNETSDNNEEVALAKKEADLAYFEMLPRTKVDRKAEEQIEAAARAKAYAEEQLRLEAAALAQKEAERKMLEATDILSKTADSTNPEIKALETDASVVAGMEAERKASEEAKARAKREAEEKARIETERKARGAAEARARAEAEARAKREAKARAEAGRKAHEEAERKAREEAKARVMREVEEEARQAAETQARALAAAKRKAQEESTARIKHLAEEKARIAAEQKVREQANAAARAKAYAEEQLRLEAAALAQKEAERNMLETADLLSKSADVADIATTAKKEEARIEAEAHLEAERKARAMSESEQEVRIQAERKTREAAEIKARAEAEAQAIREVKAREELERKEREEVKARVIREAEEEARIVAERKAREAAEARARAEAEAQAKREAKARAEVERKAREEAERKAREEAKARAKREAEEKARIETERKARKVAEARARAEAEAQAKREAKARAEAERKAREEFEALAKREAQEKARIGAELKAREAAELKAKANAEAQAKREAEETARAEAKRKAHEEAEIRAKLKAEEKARIKAERKNHEAAAKQQARLDAETRALSRAEKKALARTERSPVNINKWLTNASVIGRNTLISIVVITLVLLALLHVVNITALLNPIEKFAEENIHEPVVITEVHASLWPQPHLVLDGVTIGELSDVKIASIRISPELSTVFGKIKTLKSIEIETLTLDRNSLERPVKWMSSANKQGKLKFDRIFLTGTSIRIPNLELPPINGDIKLSSSGELRNATLNTDDHKIMIKITPNNQTYEIDLVANDWQPPLGSPVIFDQLSAKAEADSNQIIFSQIGGALYGGTIKAQMTVNWANAWNVSGNFELSRLNLQEIIPKFTSDITLKGKLNANANFSLQAADFVKLVDAPVINASFVAHNGSINGIDLIRAMRTIGKANAVSGSTRFDKFSGKMLLKDGHYQYRQLTLKEGQFLANGEADIFENRLSGNINIELTTKSRQQRSRLGLSGQLSSPMVK
jgi:hypothetical protein